MKITVDAPPKSTGIPPGIFVHSKSYEFYIASITEGGRIIATSLTNPDNFALAFTSPEEFTECFEPAIKGTKITIIA